nr:hypothetical protein [Rhizobium ruizarguesonis]
MDAIIAMDLKRREVVAQKTADKEEPEQQVSERPLTSRLFDAIFPTKRK